MRAMLQRWKQEPIIIPRWLLVTVYALFIVLGIVGALAGIPTLAAATPPWYVVPFSVAVSTTAALAIVGSTREQWARLEMVGALLLYCLWAAPTFAALWFFLVQQDLNRGAFSIGLIILLIMPLARGVQLGLKEIRTLVARWKLARGPR